MKKNKLEALYDQIKDRIEPVGKGYDVESAKVACDAFDKLSLAEKNEVYREIREVAPKAGTNSVGYRKAAIIANYLQFHVETWEKSVTK